MRANFASCDSPLPGKPVLSHISNMDSSSLMPACVRKTRLRKFRVGIQLQAVFDNVPVFCVPAGFPAADNKAAMWNAAVLPVQFFL